METVVAHVQPSSSGSNSKKASSEAPGGSDSNPAVSSSVTTTDPPSTKSNPSSSDSQPTPGTGNNNSSSSSNNPIFVITNSSSSSSVGGVPSNSNNLEMPSNSQPTSTTTCAGDPVVSSSVCAGGGGAHSEEDDGGGGTAGVNGVGSGGGNVTSPTVSSSGAGAVSSSQQQQRHSNPRQSTLTRSHAITLDEDSDGASPHVPDSVVTTSLPQEQEQELIHFIIDTCNRNVKDKHFILRIEADLTQFVKDESRLTLPFPQMTSYQRMLVHRMATLFDLDHNVDNSSGGNFVVVSKDLNGRGHGGRIPPVRFKELPSNPAMMVSTSPSSHLTNIDSSISTEVLLIDPSSGNTFTTSTSNANNVASSKKILKREKVASLGSDKKGCGGGPAKTKSLEERTQDYHKARRRIFEDNQSGESGSGISLDNSASASSKKLNWSSTDSSEDRMYLKPPFPGNASGGKLIKVESFESASQKKPSNRDSRAMGKSHSFGGYEESSSQPQSVSGHGGRGGGGAGGKHFPGVANSSNNASSSMISCSSSSSLRSSSFSKQDSSSSTTSGSGQSPSGATSSGSTSGYKSSSSSGGGVMPGYYTTGGLNGANSVGPKRATTPMGQISLHQATSDLMKAPPAIMFAPAGGPPPQQFIQSEEITSGNVVTSTNSSQQVVFCCWAVTDVNNVPPGALIIDPTTGQAAKNTDGTQYYYDPVNPPKFVQPVPATASIPQPPPSSTPQQQEYSQMYPPPTVIAGPPISAYAPMPAQPPQTPSGAGGAPHQQAAFMTIPAGAATSQIYLPTFPTPTGAVSSASHMSTGSPQDIQELSGYFSQLAVATGPGGRQGQQSVIYVPVDVNTTGTYTTQLPTDQQSQGGSGNYYEDGSQPQTPSQQQFQQAIPIQFQAPGMGYVLQQVMDPTGGSAPGVYYYGGNLMQAPTAMQSSNGSSVVQHSQHVGSHQQPRFKNWIMPHPAQQQQHSSAQAFSMHGAPGQVSAGAMASTQQQNNPGPGGGPPPGTIMIHPSVPQNSMVPGGSGLVSVPAMMPSPHPVALSGGQQQPPQQLPPQPSQQNSTLVPLSYHPTQSHHHQPHQPGSAGGNPQTLMQTLVPCVQSPVFPAPPPPPHPPLSQQVQQQQHQPQSFVPPPQHHHHQQHHPPSHPHHQTHHLTRPHHHQNHPHGAPQPHHHHPHGHGQPRFLAVTGSPAAAAAAAAAASQQQQQQQILFAAAAAAMAISNNYSNFATGAANNSTRFLKGVGRGGGGAGVHHGPVTGVVRRSRNYVPSKQQQQNSSK